MEEAEYSGTLRLEMLDLQADSDLEYMQVTGQFHDAKFSLWANGAQGHHELIRLSVPNTGEELQSDMGGHDGQVVLYKERTFDCAVEIVDSRLSRYIGPHAKLILQGHGNRCFAPPDLERWIVRFDESPGPSTQANYRAYGTIDTAGVPADWYKKH
jgi:hypothetical protein